MFLRLIGFYSPVHLGSMVEKCFVTFKVSKSDFFFFDCLFCKLVTARRVFLVQGATLDMSHHPVVFLLIVHEVFGAIVFYSFMRKSPPTDKSAVVEASAVVYKLAVASSFGHNKTLAVDPGSCWLALCSFDTPEEPYL